MILGQKDPLEKGMATHSSILAWRILWTEEPDRVHRVTESDMTERLTLSFSASYRIGKSFRRTVKFLTEHSIRNSNR